MSPVAPPAPAAPRGVALPKRLAGIIAAFVVLAACYSIVNPIFEAPDEYQHFFTARHLAQGRGFARPAPDQPWLQEAAQPPLYYLLTAALIAPLDTSDAESLLWRNPGAALGDASAFGNRNQIVHTPREQCPYRGAVLAVHAARAFSILLGAAALVFIYGCVRLLIPRAPQIALATAGLTALTPQFLFLSASISNDNLTNLAAALSAWLLLRGQRGGLDQTRPRGWPILLGLALGMLGLAKASGLLFWPLAGLVILITGWRRHNMRRAVGELITIFAIASAVAGWWYVRNWLLYRDLTGVGWLVKLMGPRPAPLTFRAFLDELRGLIYSYWGLFGWFNVLSPGWLYRLAGGASLLALLGLPMLPRLTATPPLVLRKDLPWLLLPAAWLALVLASLFQFALLTPAFQGRLVMPAAWGLNLFLVLGWAALGRSAGRLLVATPARLRQVLGTLFAVAPLALFAAWALLAPTAVIRPAYPPPQRTTADAIPAAARQAPVDMGQSARYLGGTVQPLTVRPGDVITTTVYWQALQPFPRDYTIYVHVVAPYGQLLAQSDSWPSQGSYPTRLWRTGEIVVDAHQVRIPRDADALAPALLPVATGMYLPETGEKLAAHGADGQAASASMALVRLLPRSPGRVQPAVSLPATFSNSIRLLGYTLSSSSGTIKPGESVPITLFWEADARVTEDWIVFVHLRAREGGRQVGADSRPRDGYWPTTAWEPGYLVPDPHAVTVPTDMPPGTAELWVGLYAPAGPRAPITSTMARAEGDALYLQEITIQP